MPTIKGQEVDIIIGRNSIIKRSTDAMYIYKNMHPGCPIPVSEAMRLYMNKLSLWSYESDVCF